MTGAREGSCGQVLEAAGRAPPVIAHENIIACPAIQARSCLIQINAQVVVSDNSVFVWPSRHMTHVTLTCVRMRRAPGLVLLFLSICVLSFYVQRIPYYAHHSKIRTNPADPETAIRILGEYKTFRAGLGLLEVPPNLQSSSPSHSFHAQSPSFHADNAIPLPLAHRIETGSLTFGLDDVPEHQVDVRKMLRRTSTFGLGLSTHSRRLTGDSHRMPAHPHSTLSEHGSPPSLHFAVDSIREPCISFEDVLREYALLSGKESNLGGVDTISLTRASISNSKPKTSQKGKSLSANKASARVSPGRRSRGRRRLPLRIEH